MADGTGPAPPAGTDRRTAPVPTGGPDDRWEPAGTGGRTAPGPTGGPDHRWESAGERARSADAAVRAALAALDVPALAEAEALFDRALATWDAAPPGARPGGLDRAGVLERAAETALLRGDPARALGRFRAAAAELGPDADPARLAPVRQRVARCLLHLDAPAAEVAAEHREAVRLAGRGPDAVGAEVEAGCAYDMLSLPDGLDRAAVVAGSAVRRATASGDRRALALALLARGRAAGRQDDVPTAIASLREAVELARDSGRLDILGPAVGALGAHLMGQGRLAEAVAGMASAVEHLERHGFGAHSAPLVVNTVNGLLELGRLDEAEELASRLAAGGERPLHRALALTLLATLDVQRGDLDRAAVHLAAAREASAEPLVASATALIELRHACWGEDPDAARGQFARFTALLADMSLGSSHADVAAVDAAVDMLRFEVERRHRRAAPTPSGATGAVDDLLGQVGGRPLPWRDLLTAIAAAERLQLAGADLPDVASAWRRARHLAAGCGAADRAAYSQWRLAAALVRHGSPDGPAELRRAWRDAGRIGSGMVVRGVEADAAAAGVRLRRPAAAAASPLTSREHDVVDLVAAGRTNRQIGRILGISEHTVARHVARVMRKLGAANRAEAVTRARDRRRPGPA